MHGHMCSTTADPGPWAGVGVRSPAVILLHSVAEVINADAARLLQHAAFVLGDFRLFDPRNLLADLVDACC